MIRLIQEMVSTKFMAESLKTIIGIEEDMVSLSLIHICPCFIKMFTLSISECLASNQQVRYSNSKLIFTFISFTIKQNVMSLKYSSTTADYLQWSEAMNLIRKLARDSNYKMSLLIALGCFTGLRISRCV